MTQRGVIEGENVMFLTMTNRHAIISKFVPNPTDAPWCTSCDDPSAKAPRYLLHYATMFGRNVASSQARRNQEVTI